MKLRFSILIYFLVATVAFGQDADKLFKDANKAYGSFTLGNDDADASIAEAKDLIEQVMSSPEYQKDTKAWLLKGKIYQGMTEQNVTALTIGQECKYPNAGIESLDAYKMAVQTAEKKSDLSKALKQIAELSGFLSQMGNNYINTQDYASAYKPLNAVLMADEILVENEQESLFNTEEDKASHKYAVAACAMEAGENENAKMLFKEMVEEGSTDPKIYSSLFTLTVAENEEEALTYLAKGQELDPNNLELLYAEINYLIQKENFEKLQLKLKQAIENDPDNTSIRLALGNVYSKLAEQEMANGNMEAADEYTKQSSEYFEQVLQMDPSSNEALYMLGSIYFNKGAALTKEMSDLGLSAEDQKKYDELDAQVKEYFEKALPYFKRSESMDPNDTSTLYALKEIYARMNDFEMSNEFKDRLDKVQAGETLSGSYFEN
jgi:tetratricopeptide (TPR) repeat protein